MPPNKYTGTVSLVVPDKEGNDPPRHGDTISFEGSSDAPGPFVHLVVEQNGEPVLEGWSTLAAGANFTLNSPAYSGGAAKGYGHLIYVIRVGPHGPIWSDPLDTAEFDIDA